MEQKKSIFADGTIGSLLITVYAGFGPIFEDQTHRASCRNENGLIRFWDATRLTLQLIYMIDLKQKLLELRSKSSTAAGAKPLGSLMTVAFKLRRHRIVHCRNSARD